MNLCYESSNELYHHGIKGMKWGRRRFQNSDGSLTAAGRKRYSGGGITGAIRNKQYSNAERDLANVKSKQKQVNSELRELKGYAKNPTGLANSKISTAIRNKQIRDLEKSKSQLKSREKDNRDAIRELDEIDKAQAQKRAERNTPEAKAARRKKALKVGAAVAGTVLATYGAYKAHNYIKTKNVQLSAKKGAELAAKYGLSGIGISDEAYSAARRAQNDSLAKAAKNVASFKLGGGRMKELSDFAGNNYLLKYHNKYIAI